MPLIFLLLVVAVNIQRPFVSTANPVSYVDRLSDDIVGHLPMNAQEINEVKIEGNYVYVSFDESWLGVVDVTIPTTPTLVTQYDISERILDITVVNHHIYLGTLSGIKIVQFDESKNELTFADEYLQDLVVETIYEQGFLYSLSRNEIQIFDVSNLGELNLIHTYIDEVDNRNPIALDVYKQFVFTLNGLPNDHVLKINLTNSDEPQTIVFDGVGDPIRMSVNHNRLLFLDTSCGSTCLTIFRVFEWESSTDEISHLGSYTLDGSLPGSIEVDNFYVYVGNESGLFVFSLYEESESSDGYKQAPKLIESQEFSDVISVDFDEQYIYALSEVGGLFIVEKPPTYQMYLPVIVTTP